MQRLWAHCAIALAGALASLVSAAHAAEPFPSRPVRIVVPYAAGGGPDLLARAMVPKLSETLGQQVVVENKVGAAGVIAAQMVAQAPADGYTLLLGSNTHLIQKLLAPSLKFDPLADFVAVGNVSTTPTVLVVRTDAAYQSVADLVAAAKQRAGSFNYGSGGIGTSAHLAGATFSAIAGLQAVHVPLKGSVEIAGSLMRGETEFAFPVSSTAIPQIKAGRLRALGVTSGARLKDLSEVPTMAEATGQPLMIQESWFGLWAPAGTAPEVVDKLHAALAKALADPGVIAKFDASGSPPTPSASPREFGEFVRTENAKWAQIVRIAAVPAQ